MTLLSVFNRIPFLRSICESTVKQRVGDFLNDSMVVICPFVLAWLWIVAVPAKHR